ncbi:phosphonate C-P lyase system protein PhnG [Caulobacter sp. KR2-114]|uniref:phosphonate C-P lyase system protein PhnG n=1 Tax=Caulobacter sp. KR2-114 TaxID=3400912 RepID=UPI003C091E04
MLVDPVVEPPCYGRKEWLSVLAKARAAELVEAWEALDSRPGYQALRAPELGLVLVRGRMGGLGDAFNLGEMTVTRAAVRLESGETGLAYVAGRERRHAEIAAAVDAMMQSPALRPQVEAPVVARLHRAQEARRTLAARKAAATTVDFFTMVTGRGGA